MLERKLNVEDMIKNCQKNWSQEYQDAGATAVRMIRASDVVLNNGRRLVDQFDLTMAEFDTLATLRKLGQPFELSPSNLCQANLLSSGGLTKVLNNLEARGLIARVAHEEDKRSRIVRLSDSGIELIDQAMHRVLAEHEKMFKDVFTEDERAQLNDLLSKFHRVMETRY